jgi:membrane protein
MGMVKDRVLSFTMVLGIGFLLLVSLVVSAALAALGSWWGGIFGDMEWLFHVLDIVVSIAVVAVMFALMYKILPRVKIAWHDVWIGAIVTSLLFAVGKFLVGLYVGKASVESSFGTAGSLAVLLVWVYYSAQIFLLGAEFTWVYAHKFGSRQGKDQPATAKEAVATTGEPEGDRPAHAHGRPARPVTLEGPAAGVAALASRHTAALTAGAIVLGALAGRLVDRTKRA